MAYNVKHIPAFGGGLNFTAHPANIGDNEWSFSNGFFAKDGYAEVCTAMDVSGQTTTIATASHTATGVFANPFDDGATVSPLYYVTSSSAGGVGKLWSVIGNGAATEITASGGFAPAATIAGTPDACMLENDLYVSFGLVTPGANFGVVKLTPTAAGAGPATFTRIDKITNAEISDTLSGADSLTTAFLETCKDIIVAAGCSRISTQSRRTATRSVARCDSFRGHLWNERLWNTAKFEEFTELPWGFTGMARADDNTVLLFCPDRIITLQYTGANPPFTRNFAQMGGNIAGATTTTTATNLGARGGVNLTPLGVCFRGDDNVYLWGGGPQPIANPIRQYIREKESLSARILNPIWHAHWGLLLVPVAIGSGYEIFMYDPSSKAWSRRVLDLGGELPVGQVYNPSSSSTTGRYTGRWGVVLEDGNVCQEHTPQLQTPNPYSGAFVDTKDFHFDDPSSNDYIDRIGVDWEPLTNASTDAITVSASTRDDFSPTTLGSLGADTQPSFTLQGTLTGGVSELPLRLRGKFVRFRFTQSSGRARIRGFTLRWQRGSERTS